MTLLIANAVLFALLAIAARASSRRVRPRVRAGVAIVIALLCLPATLYSFYYLHLFDDWLSFIRFRSHAWANFYPATLGLLAGWLFDRRRLLALGAFAVLPFLKPVVAPLDESILSDRWRDGVCLQSTPSTCGPASVATILANRYRDPVGERTVALASRTAATGTEVWYLAQFLRARGYDVRFHRGSNMLPHSVAGMRMGRFGHFVAVLTCESNGCEIADPLSGRVTKNEHLVFTGFSMQISR